MARGNGGQPLLTLPGDWLELLEVLRFVKGTSDFSLYAFCLMTNHFHLLIEIGADSLSHVMHRIQTTWAKRFNIARKRRGHVFQDRFKSRLCETDEYLMWLLRYIHMNPVRAKLVSAPEDWPWSSFRQYLGLENGIADTAWPLSLFGAEGEGAIAAFRSFVHAGSNDEKEPLELSDSRPVPEGTERRSAETTEPQSFEAISHDIASRAGLDSAAILGSSRARPLCEARKLIVRRALAAGIRATDLARRLGVSPTAVSKLARRKGESAGSK